jgi:hypothetical protein
VSTGRCTVSMSHAVRSGPFRRSRDEQGGPLPRRLTIRAALCAAAVLGALTAPSGLAGVAVAKPKPHSVLVDRGGIVLQVFTNAKCSISKRNGFLASSKALGAELHVRVKPFAGFHEYPLKPGQQDAPIRQTFVSFTTPSGVEFASDFIPPYPVPSLGAVKFSDTGKLIGVGFQPMFDASGSEAVIVTGVMVCHYPKKKGKR